MSGVSDGGQRGREVLERAERMLPPDDHVVGSRSVGAGEHMPRPRKGRRPVVFRGERMRGDRLARVTLGLFRLSLMQWNPVDAVYEAVEERERSKGQPFFGGWGSLAGQLTCGLYPRTKTGADTVLVLTDRRLQLVYVQRALIGERLGPNTELGWGVQLDQVAWIRDRSDVKGGTHEIGFADGSWATVIFPGTGWSKFADAFPHPLRHTDRIP